MLETVYYVTMYNSGNFWDAVTKKSIILENATEQGEIDYFLFCTSLQMCQIN